MSPKQSWRKSEKAEKKEYPIHKIKGKYKKYGKIK